MASFTVADLQASIAGRRIAPGKLPQNPFIEISPSPITPSA